MPLGPYCTIGAPGVLIQQWHPLVFLNFKSVFMYFSGTKLSKIGPPSLGPCQGGLQAWGHAQGQWVGHNPQHLWGQVAAQPMGPPTAH